MEVKINKEIRNYTESMFFGLSLRQFVFSLLAIGVAVALYFLLRPYVGLETLSWIVILAAAPFGALGFFSYHDKENTVRPDAPDGDHVLYTKEVSLWKSRSTAKFAIIRNPCFSDCPCGSSFFLSWRFLSPWDCTFC